MITAPASRNRSTMRASASGCRPSKDRSAALRGHVARVDNVLETDRHPVQRTGGPARTADTVQLRGLLKRLVRSKSAHAWMVASVCSIRARYDSTNDLRTAALRDGRRPRLPRAVSDLPSSGPRRRRDSQEATERCRGTDTSTPCQDDDAQIGHDALEYLDQLDLFFEHALSDSRPTSPSAGSGRRSAGSAPPASRKKYGFTPNVSSIGRKIGTKMIRISDHSSGHPRTKIISCASTRNCQGSRFMPTTQSLNHVVPAKVRKHRSKSP